MEVGIHMQRNWDLCFLGSPPDAHRNACLCVCAHVAACLHVDACLFAGCWHKKEARGRRGRSAGCGQGPRVLARLCVLAATRGCVHLCASLQLPEGVCTCVRPCSYQRVCAPVCVGICQYVRASVWMGIHMHQVCLPSNILRAAMSALTYYGQPC